MTDARPLRSGNARASCDLTPKQYYDQRIKHIRYSYPCTLAEARETLPLDHARDEHFVFCLEHVRSGGVLRPAVMDRLTPGQRYRLLHDHPAFRERMAMAGYVTPEGKANRAKQP